MITLFILKKKFIKIKNNNYAFEFVANTLNIQILNKLIYDNYYYNYYNEHGNYCVELKTGAYFELFLLNEKQQQQIELNIGDKLYIFDDFCNNTYDDIYEINIGAFDLNTLKDTLDIDLPTNFQGTKGSNDPVPLDIHKGDFMDIS